VVGWEQMNPRAKYGGPSYKVLPEKGAAEVSFSSPVQVTITCKATPQSPRINEKDDMVEQPVLVETPWGNVEVRIRIYQNPDRGFGGGKNWDFDAEVAEKRAELDRQVAGRLHMSGEMPKVEFKVTNWVDTYRVGGSWESTDGYMAGDSSHTESVRRGGVSLTVWSPFLQTATDEFHRETGREGVGAVISVRGMATREAVEKAAKELISRAVKHWNLQSGAGEQYAEKLLAHIISHVPKFQSMGGLWVVDEDADRVGQLMLGIPHGLTVMEFEQIGGTNPYLPNEVASRAVRVINRLYAEKYGIPGALAEGELVVYWPEGQKDPTSPEELAERIRAIVKPDPWKSSPEERWFPEFATPKDVEYAERLLEQFGYQEGGSGWGRQYWVDKASAFLLRLETELKPELLELGRRQEVGEVLVNWKRGRRRQGAAGNCDAWVVRPDSTCREPDRVGNERHTRSLFWRLVEAEELALSWSGGRTGEVAKLPVGGCTPEQLAAVSEVEKELGLEPNSFGLNAEAGQAQEKLVEAATAVLLQKSKVFRRLPQTLEYHLLVSEDGQFVSGNQTVWDERTNEERVDNSWLKRSLQSLDKGTSTATATIANRAAQLIEASPLEGGILEVWLFNKYGHWNLAIRWRELAEGEVPGLANEVNPDNPMAQALRQAGLA
ncbi:MAG: hypothetical protein PHQ43_15550, partial [Dehalococcoidales bacterium]|nr:hypothetical protein [Dehalococcoidales bacterium]